MTVITSTDVLAFNTELSRRRTEGRKSGELHEAASLEAIKDEPDEAHVNNLVVS
ncbi:hypothetical protein ABC337_13890 [Arthrobacter sp. 1P04PC]|uniref:hypothetical protein n=1 Tax=unclassified Arthrobacter TaxID=235627 RepID=UPI0039A3C2DC